MRVFVSLMLSMVVLSGCSAEGRLMDRLLETAVTQAEANDCAAVTDASEIALAAGYYDLADRIRAIDVNPGCPTLGESGVRSPGWLDGLTIAVGAANGLGWGLTWVEGRFDPAARRAHAHYHDLTATCRRFTADALGRWPELIEIYLSEPDQRVIPARRGASDQLAVCVDGYLAAALAHRAQGEDDWADYWLSMGAYLPAGAGEPLIRRALSEDPDGPYAAYDTLALGAALLERIELADFQAIARLAGDASIAQSLEPGYGDIDLLAAIDVAQAVGFDIHPAWRTIERDPVMSDYNLSSLISRWVRGGGLDGEAVPALFADLAAQCAPGTDIHVTGFDSRPIDQDAQVFSRMGCQRAFNQVGAAAGYADASAALIEEQLVDALRSQRVDTDLIEALGAYTRDDVASFTVFAPDDSHTIDLYGCVRPSPALQPYWDAARPGPESLHCRRLAEAAPGWHDYEALSAALPFDGCDAEALAQSDAGLLRPVQYAAQTGDPAAFACFAEAAALGADLTASNPARTSLLTGVYAGVRLGRLDADHWRIAGGAHAYSSRHIQLLAESGFDHLETWGEGPDPLAEAADSLTPPPAPK
jgi:hypothetical protein